MYPSIRLGAKPSSATTATLLFAMISEPNLFGRSDHRRGRSYALLEQRNLLAASFPDGRHGRLTQRGVVHMHATQPAVPLPDEHYRSPNVHGVTLDKDPVVERHHRGIRP